ncbi:hypothetical protein FRB94_003373 [Tulasnella sp. JGI-2019a]|nr:hypothetical protein FRB94_003373 [Tulasnella sp. JGI-2019a]
MSMFLSFRLILFRPPSDPCIVVLAPQLSNIRSIEPPPCTTLVLVCIRSVPGAVNWNKAADNDIRLWFRATGETLKRPQTRLFIVTDCVDFQIPPDIKATVRLVFPSRLNVEWVIRSATTGLRALDECTLWFSCTAQIDAQAIRLVDPLEVIDGPELYSWLTENTTHSALIRLGLDFCYSGNFLSLPWYFSSEGQLFFQPNLPGIIGWAPRIICISACQSDQFAHHVASNNNPEEQWGGLLWYLVWAHLEGNPPVNCLCDVDAILSPRLSDMAHGEWDQNPQVSLSYYDVDVVFRNWF